MAEKKNFFIVPTCPPFILQAHPDKCGKVPVKELIEEMRKEVSQELGAKAFKRSSKPRGKPKRPATPNPKKPQRQQKRQKHLRRGKK